MMTFPADCSMIISDRDWLLVWLRNLLNILLIESAKAQRTIGGEDVFLYEPLALEYLAAGVSKYHEVRIIDMRLEKGLREVVEHFRPDVVGITSYTVHVNTVRKLFAQIKLWNPGVLTVVGGHHATVVPEDFVSPDIDLIVMGEGVYPFKDIVTRFENGDGYEGIPGTAFVKNGTFFKTKPEVVNDLDIFPFPDRSLTSQYRHHYPNGLR